VTSRDSRPSCLYGQHVFGVDDRSRKPIIKLIVRLALASVYHLSPVVEELRHPAESTAVNFEPSFKHVHEDRMIDGVEDGYRSSTTWALM